MRRRERCMGASLYALLFVDRELKRSGVRGKNCSF